MIIKEFWIFSENWEPYVNFLVDPLNSNSFIFQEVDMANLVGIKELIQQNSSQNLNPIEHQNDKYYIAFCFQKKIYILIKTNREIKDKKIIKLSKTLCEMVENLYKMIDFINWKADISLFEILKKKLNLFLKMSNL